MVFPKKSRWNLIFFVLSGKMIFLFPENIILPPNGKWKMIFLKKIHGNMIFFLNVLKRLSFQKGPHRDMIFLYYLERWYFFPQKCGIFSLDGKWERGGLSQEIHGNMIFSIWYVPCPPAKIKQRRSYPAKIHLKVIDIPDRHPRKSSSNSLYLHGDLYRCFHILLSIKKNRKLNI